MTHHEHHDTDEQPVDKMILDKIALRKSQAGMRFIAQMHIYNTLNWDRLDQFINDSYHDTLLQQQSVGLRLDTLQAVHAHVGRMKVKQVVATNEHHAVIVMEPEQSDSYFYAEIKVEEDYPHKITFFMLQRMQPAN